MTDPSQLRITAVLAALAVAVGAVMMQTWRLHSLQAEYADLVASVAKNRAARAEAYTQDSEKTAAKERIHGTDTLHAAEAFAAGAPGREDRLRADLADARRLLDAAGKRAAGYRAQASADAASCRRLADRSAALDRSLAEGRGVVAELRGIVERRDAEVKLLADLLKADEALVGEPGVASDHAPGPAHLRPEW